MHQPRLPPPSSTGRCRSSNVDSTRLFAKFGPRRKKHMKGEVEGGCQPARFAKCGVGWRKIGCEITPTASFIILFLSPLSLSLQKWGSFGQTERRTERHLLAPSRAFYHRENLPASFICANWATTNLGLQGVDHGRTGFRFHEGSLPRSLSPSCRDSRVRFVDRFLRRPILHYVLRLRDPGDRDRRMPTPRE